MFYLIQAIAVWVLAFWLIDWRRLRELILYGLLGTVAAGTQNSLGLIAGFWEYRDIGPIDSHIKIDLLICLSAAPLVAIYFVQGLKRRSTVPWPRIAAFTVIGMIPEIIALNLGFIVHGRGWNPWHSVLAYLLLWLGFWSFYRWQQTGERGEK